MDGTNELKETPRVTAPVASGTLSVNVFTAPGKPMVGERSKSFGEALGFDPITSTLVARFDQVIDVSDTDRALAFANIGKAANYYEVDLAETSWHDLG